MRLGCALTALLALVGLFATPPDARAVVDLSVIRCNVVDTCPSGTGNGEIDPGETGVLAFNLQNDGDQLATNVTVTVSSPTPGVTMLVGMARSNDIPGMGGLGFLMPDIEYSVGANVPCGTMVQFDIFVSSDQQSIFSACSFVVPVNCTVCVDLNAPIFNVTSCAIVLDTCPLGGGGGGNLLAEPGENVGLLVSVENQSGVVGATRVTATFSTMTPGVTITMPTVPLPDLPAGGGPRMALANVQFSLGLGVPCGTVIMFNVVLASAEGNGFDTCDIMVPVNCVVCPSPDLRVDSCTLTDVCPSGGPGSDDGNLDPGETGTMRLLVANVGTLGANNVEVTATSPTPGVRITVALSRFGTIPAGGNGAGNPSLEFEVDSTVPCGTLVVIDLVISSDEQTVMSSCSYQIPVACTPCIDPSGPNLVVASCMLASDTCPLGTPSNGTIEPGENGTLAVELANTGAVGTATMVTATFTALTPGVTMTQPTMNFPDLPAGGMPFAGAPAAAFTVADNVPCGTTIRFSILIVSIQGQFVGACQVTIPTPCVPCTANAVLTVDSCAHADSCPFGGSGDANAAVDPGENVALTVTLRNVGQSAATGVSATLTSPTPGVTILQSMTAFPMIAAGGTAVGAPALAYRVGVGVPCGTNIVLNLAITSVQGSFAGSCSVLVPVNCTPCQLTPPVDLAFDSAAIATDSCASGGTGDQNGEADPGEDVTMNLTIRNAGAAPVTAVMGTLASVTPGVTVTTAVASFGNIAAGATATSQTAFAYTVDSALIACGDALDFQLSFTTGQGVPPPVATTGIAVPDPCDSCTVGVQPPEEVPWLLPHCVGGGVDIEWQAALRATTYAVYQGTIDSLSMMAAYDHACSVSALVPPLLTTLASATCGDGVDAYFLIVGVNSLGEGPYGNGGLGPRPAAPVLCP